jgi:hypothetical protein
MDSSAHSLPTGWCAFTDEKTQRTYYAHVSGIVRWDPPPSNPPPPTRQSGGNSKSSSGAMPPALNQQHSGAAAHGYHSHNYQQDAQKRDYDQFQLYNHNYYNAYSKRACYGYQSNYQPEVLSKTCSRCSKDIVRKDYSNRQWLKKHGERRCIECVKAVLAANKAIVESIHGIALGSGSLYRAEKVSPSSSVTND